MPAAGDACRRWSWCPPIWVSVLVDERLERARSAELDERDGRGTGENGGAERRPAGRARGEHADAVDEIAVRVAARRPLDPARQQLAREIRGRQHRQREEERD